MKLFDMLFKRKDKSEKIQVVQADEKESAEVVQQLSADKDNTDETIDSNEPQKNIQTEKKYSVEGSDGNALPQELIRKLMTDKEKQNICKSELYEACLKLHCELSAYTDSLSDLSELVGECFMPAPIADPEVSDYIEANVVYGQGLEQEIPYAISNTFGFGGHNAVLAFKRWENK